MADLNSALKESYIGKVADALGPYADELKAKGFDPSSRIQQLTAAGPLIAAAAKARNTAEQAAREAIKAESDLRTQFYKLASASVSLVEGLVTKDHPLTADLRSLRADLIGTQQGSHAPAAPSAQAAATIH